jgi:hypothetical protein
MKKSILVKTVAAIFTIGAVFPLGAIAAPPANSKDKHSATQNTQNSQNTQAPRKPHFAKGWLDS